MRGLVKVLFLFSFFGFFLGFAGNVGGAVLKNDAVYLFLGLDDAAKNADSIILLSYKGEDNSTSVIQIPRDSYVDYGSENKKLNGIYSYYVSMGFSPKESLNKSADFISREFGTRIDGSFAITTEAFRSMVDSLGGVKINMSQNFEISDSRGKIQLSLKAGENLLNGRDAELFVRHRKSFVTGDLGRLENQRIFLKAFLKTVFSDFSIERITSALKSMGDGLVCDLSLLDSALLASKYSKRIIRSDTVFLTMPGEASKDESGIWYYILNRDESYKLVKSRLVPSGFLQTQS